MKRLLFLIMSALLPMIVLAMVTSCQFKKSSTESSQSDERAVENEDEPEVAGTFTLYYALDDFGATTYWSEDNPGDVRSFKKGELICTSNDMYSEISDYNDKFYKYSFEFQESSFWYLSKDKVKIETYTLNQLPVANIKDGLTFVSENGNVARFFKSNINGHTYYKYENNDYDAVVEDLDANNLFENCYVFQFIQDGEILIETPLKEQLGHVILYNRGKGWLRQDWYTYGGEQEPGESAYSADGKLMFDLIQSDGMPEEISIAYVASENALFIEREWYYLKK